MSKEKKGGAGDELNELKAKLLAREMELITEKDTMKRIQKRSYEIELHMDRISTKSREKIQSLEDIISLINFDAKVKDKRILDLEAELAKFKEDTEAIMKKMAKEMEDATANFEFKYESVKLQLEAAQIKLRELHEFGQKKVALEKELLDTRAALLKEHESKIEMVGEAERASHAAQEKMRKQMETLVVETEARMTKTIELQLHSKTKKTIIENEELKAEVQYHTQATMTLYKENEQLIEKNLAHLRSIDLLQVMKSDLEQKTYMYQKTLHILVHKLREKENQLARTQAKILFEMTTEQRQNEEEFQELLIRAAHLKDVKTSPKLKQSKAKGTVGPEPSQKLIQESAIKFLYACLEDMELETFSRVVEEGAQSSEVPSDVPLDQLDMKQRHHLLKSLLKRASIVRVMMQSLSNGAQDKKKVLRHVPYSPVINPLNPTGKVAFDVQDVLDIPFGKIMASELGDRSSQF